MTNVMPSVPFLAPSFGLAYLGQVSLFARHFGKSPEQLGPEEIRSYQIYLAQERKVSVGTRIVAVSALRFVFAITLKRDWTVQLIPGPKKDYRLPVILSPQEVLEVLQAAPSFTHHVIFSTMYGTGMRVWRARRAISTLRPQLHAATGRKRGRKQKNVTPVDEHYEHLRDGMRELFDELGIAA
jgi:integrase/recombinase XerD